MSLSMAYNVFALCVVWGLKPFSTEMLLTMIQCLIDICKAEINNFPEGGNICKCLILPPKLCKACVSKQYAPQCLKMLLLCLNCFNLKMNLSV